MMGATLLGRNLSFQILLYALIQGSIGFNQLSGSPFQDDGKCAKDKPCSIGCCSSAGWCGYGPDYCSPESCIGTCNITSECNGGGWDRKYYKIETCPLNVCCSKHGFCGTTKDFCGDAEVSRPSCSKDGHTSVFQRVIGYYEGWGVRRPCNAIAPEDIPQGVYTHINFAFATVDPATYLVRPAHSGDPGLYARVARLKQSDPMLKVFIAIGGWAFSDPGPTRKVFTEIAGSERYKRAFIASLVSFMATYDFDGVDIDWEYPAADDRGGEMADFKNFPTLIRDIKNALKGTGGRDGVSLTLPASYWYLQHFDIRELQTHVDFFNIMSYDLHGLWDRGNKWTGNFLNSHTNLTEIDLALDLLWRNNIEPGKVVLGLAFYARVFTASDRSCMKPKCFFDRAGIPGPCSREGGILMNSEIMDLIQTKGLRPTLLKAETVKELAWDDQWLTYDDAQTLLMKADFARERCLNGVMVWAISHDTEDGRFASAVAQATGRNLIQRSKSGKIQVPQGQCKWTNCGEVCPLGWKTVARSDPGARKGELMLDSTYCDKGKTHTLCCPGDQDIPECGWWGHRNGKCKPGCPSGFIEIGSNGQYCNNKSWQTACCKPNSALSTYATCEWNQRDGNCQLNRPCGPPKGTEMCTGISGSGASSCVQLETPYWNAFKYCCDTSDPNSRMEDCQWFYDIGGPQRVGRGGHHQCLPNCPTDRVRVGLDGMGGQPTSCYNDPRGARARCCVPKKFTEAPADGIPLSEYKNALDQYLKHPVCRNPGPLQRGFSLAQTAFRTIGGTVELRVGNISTETDPASRPMVRLASGSDSLVESLCVYLMTTQNRDAGYYGQRKDTWDRSVGGAGYRFLELDFLEPTAKKSKEWKRKGPLQICHDLTCHMHVWNASVFDKVTAATPSRKLRCPSCRIGGECDEPSDHDPENGTENARLRKRLWSIAVKILPRTVVNKFRPQIGNPRSFTITYSQADGSIESSVDSRRYLTGDEYPANHPARSHAMRDADEDDCENVNMEATYIGVGETSGWEAEHADELNTIPTMINDFAANRLPSGTIVRIGNANIGFFRTALTQPYLSNPPPMDGGFNSKIPIARLFECLGSDTNSLHFLFLQGDPNKLKSRIWRVLGNIFAEKKMNNWLNKQPDRFIGSLKDILLSFEYFNDPYFNQQFVAINNCVRAQLVLIEREWNSNNPLALHMKLVDFWDLWIRDKITHVVANAKKFMYLWIGKAKEKYEPLAEQDDDDAHQILETLATYEILTNALDIHSEGLTKKIA